MKFLLIGAAVIYLAIASAQKSEDEESKGLTCLEQRALEQKNKKTVESSVQEIFGDHDLSAVDKYIHNDLIQHNPNEEDGKEAFKLFAAEWTNQTQKGQIDIRRISSEGDLVWAHLKIRSPEGMDLAIMDIFKLENGKIVEHWDVIQPIPDLKESKNPHPFF